jgi:catalase
MRTPSRVRSLLAGLILIAVPIAAHAQEATAEGLVDALNAVFGKHPGKRAGHAKGFCIKGSFTPSAEASSYSKAPHFAASKPVPVLGRFSLGGGNPAAADNAKDQARGLALKFDLGKDGATDMVMISTPVFVAKTPEQFLALLQTLASKDADKIAAFFKANPNTTRQGAWLNAHPVPASYATVTYYGVHTFTLTNAKGESQIIKWKVVPTGGEAGLSDEEAKAKSPDFYKGELTERLAKGPATFHLTAVLGQPGDNLDDPTAFWPEDRKSVDMGTLSITALEDDATCDAGIFDPTNVVDGIAGPANDTLFPMRSAAYAVSYGRRLESAAP